MMISGFIGLHILNSKLRENRWGLDSLLIRDRPLFNSRYYFKTYNLPGLSRLIADTISRIVLTFSRPFENYLIAEILDSGYSSSNRSKIGNGISFLFIFDEDGSIKKALYSVSIYR